MRHEGSISHGLKINGLKINKFTIYDRYLVYVSVAITIYDSRQLKRKLMLRGNGMFAYTIKCMTASTVIWKSFAIANRMTICGYLSFDHNFMTFS